MGKKYNIDLEELRKFILKHPDYHNDRIACAFGMGRTSMYGYIKQLGFVRKHTMMGLRYELIETEKEEVKSPRPEVNVTKGKKNPYLPPFSITHDADDKISTDQIRKNTDIDLRLLEREIRRKVSEVKTTGKMKGSPYREITVAIPQEIYYQFQCIRLHEANLMAMNKPLENWTKSECMRMSVEGMWFLQVIIDGMNEKIKDWEDDDGIEKVAVHTGANEWKPCDTKSDKNKKCAQS